MKAQSIFFAACALVGVLSAPYSTVPKNNNVKVITVVKKVVVTKTCNVAPGPTGAGYQSPQAQPTPAEKPEEVKIHEPVVEPPVSQKQQSTPEPPAPKQYVAPPVSEPASPPVKVEEPIVHAPVKVESVPPPTTYNQPTPHYQPVVKPKPKPVVEPKPVEPVKPVKPVEPVKPDEPIKPTSAYTPATDFAYSAFGGRATWFDPGMGSCGDSSTATEYIVAFPHELMEAHETGNPNHNPLCNRKVLISANGKELVCIIKDKCPGCTKEHLDLSPAAFEYFGARGLGNLTIKWMVLAL